MELLPKLMEVEYSKSDARVALIPFIETSKHDGLEVALCP
jgi:hypothetical protein